MSDVPDAAAVAATIRQLKDEHNRKVRSLLSSIDALEKQLAASKAMRNDSRRQQMIPLFRQKIKEQELTIDVLKHALCKDNRAPMTMKQVDELIIRQTLGGPKRFRPASKEEMELRIASLKQQLKHCQAQLQGQAASKNRQPPAASADTPQSKQEAGASSSIMGDNESIVPERWDADERERLYLLVQSKDEVIHRQEASIAELKAQLRASNEHCAQYQEYEMQLRSLRSKHEALQSEHYAVVRQYDEAQEQLDQAAAQADLDKADFHLEVEALREQVERLLERNAALLGEMQAKEDELLELTCIAK